MTTTSLADPWVKDEIIRILNNNADYPANNRAEIQKAQEAIDREVKIGGRTHPEESKTLKVQVKDNFQRFNETWDAYVLTQKIPSSEKEKVKALRETLDEVTDMIVDGLTVSPLVASLIPQVDQAYINDVKNLFINTTYDNNPQAAKDKINVIINGDGDKRVAIQDKTVFSGNKEATIKLLELVSQNFETYNKAFDEYVATLSLPTDATERKAALREAVIRVLVTMGGNTTPVVPLSDKIPLDAYVFLGESVVGNLVLDPVALGRPFLEPFLPSPLGEENLTQSAGDKTEGLLVGGQTIGIISPFYGWGGLLAENDDSDRVLFSLGDLSRSARDLQLQQKLTLFTGGDDHPALMVSGLLVNQGILYSQLSRAWYAQYNVQLNEEVGKGTFGSEAQETVEELCNSTDHYYDITSASCLTEEGGDLLQVEQLCSEAGGTFDTSTGTCSVVEETATSSENDPIVEGVPIARLSLALLTASNAVTVQNETSNILAASGGKPEGIAAAIGVVAFDAFAMPRLAMAYPLPQYIPLSTPTIKEPPSEPDSDEIKQEFPLNSAIAAGYGGVGGFLSYDYDGSNNIDHLFAQRWAKGANMLFVSPIKVDLSHYYARSSDDSSMFKVFNGLLYASEAAGGWGDGRLNYRLLRRSIDEKDNGLYWGRVAAVGALEVAGYTQMAIHSAEENHYGIMATRAASEGGGLAFQAIVDALNLERTVADGTITIMPEEGGAVAVNLPGAGERRVTVGIDPAFLPSENGSASLETGITPSVALDIGKVHLGAEVTFVPGKGPRAGLISAQIFKF